MRNLSPAQKQWVNAQLKAYEQNPEAFFANLLDKALHVVELLNTELEYTPDRSLVNKGVADSLLMCHAEILDRLEDELY